MIRYGRSSANVCGVNVGIHRDTGVCDNRNNGGGSTCADFDIDLDIDTTTALVPHLCRTCAALVPHLCRTCAALVPHLCRTCAALVPHLCRTCAAMWTDLRRGLLCARSRTPKCAKLGPGASLVHVRRALRAGFRGFEHQKNEKKGIQPSPAANSAAVAPPSAPPPSARRIADSAHRRRPGRGCAGKCSL